MCIQYNPGVFGTRLSEKMTEAGISEKELAGRLEIGDDSLIKSWQSGEEFPEIEQVAKICGIVGCDIKAMLS